jgi:hypothetical protein
MPFLLYRKKSRIFGVLGFGDPQRFPEGPTVWGRQCGAAQAKTPTSAIEVVRLGPRGGLTAAPIADGRWPNGPMAYCWAEHSRASAIIEARFAFGLRAGCDQRCVRLENQSIERCRVRSRATWLRGLVGTATHGRTMGFLTICHVCPSQRFTGISINQPFSTSTAAAVSRLSRSRGRGPWLLRSFMRTVDPFHLCKKSSIRWAC